MSFLWNLRQHQQIKGTRKAISRAANDANSARLRNEVVDTQVGELNDQVNHLTLVSEALWELLAERTGLTEDDLARKIDELGTRSAPSEQFTHCLCGAKMRVAAAACDYCGRARPPTIQEF